MNTVGRRLAQARLYAITPDSSPERILHLAAAYLQGGVEILQLRSKQLSRPELLELARELRQLTSAANVLLIINDYLDIALLSDADGVHLGDEDLSLPAARAVAGKRLLLGASASTTQAAIAAIDAGADYLGSGPAFATPLKPKKEVIGPSGIAQIQAISEVPIFAIGGIDLPRIRELRAVGIDRVCAIRALADDPDPEAMARRLKSDLYS